jgi:hypothetical protein
MFAAKEVGSGGYAQYEVTYLPVKGGSGGGVPCYMVCVPLALIHPVREYLSRAKCKFTGRSSTDRGRAEFFVEVIPQQVINRLVESTLQNGGRVDLGNSKLTSPNAPGIEVNIAICPLTQDQILTIKVNGKEVPASHDDYEDYQWWLAQDSLDLKLKTFLEMAIAGTERDIVFYYDARINLNLQELLESCGFFYCPGKEAMRYCNS